MLQFMIAEYLNAAIWTVSITTHRNCVFFIENLFAQREYTAGMSVRMEWERYHIDVVDVVVLAFTPT